MKEFVNQLLMQGATGILNIVVQILAGILVYFVTKFVIQKFGKDNANIFVQSVEQTMGGGNGANKKALVKQFLQAKLGWLMSSDQIDHLIEATVFEMNQAKNQALQSQAVVNYSAPQVTLNPADVANVIQNIQTTPQAGE